MLGRSESQTRQINNDQTWVQLNVLYFFRYRILQTFQAKVRGDNEYLETRDAGSWLDGDPPVLQVPVISFMGVGGVKYGGKDFYL